MSYELLTGLTAMASGAFVILTYQNHRKAAKALNAAKEATASVNVLSDLVRYQVKVINDQTKAHIDVFTSDHDKRLSKIESRIDDVSSRVAALQIKR